MLAVLKTQGLTLIVILVMHHHPDHVGGLAALPSLLQGKVYGPARETISGPIMSLNGGDRISVPGLAFDVIDVPGHSAVQQGAADRSGPAVLGALREWKNNFR